MVHGLRLRRRERLHRLRGFAPLAEPFNKLLKRVANSWREWRFGPVRVINHGLYAAAGAFVALSIVGTLAGADQIIPMMVIASSVVIASAVWAQLVEGSPSLLRPF